MGDTKNLVAKEAIEKIKELVDDANTCHFVTNLSSTPLSSRPMATQQVDDAGCIWFMSDKDSDKNQDIQSDKRVQLFYSAHGSSEYLSIYGTAEIIFDKQKIHELWSDIVKAWFPEGEDDPAISLLKVTPEDGYYWDIKNNRLVSLFKIAKAAVTGDKADEGVQGSLNVK